MQKQLEKAGSTGARSTKKLAATVNKSVSKRAVLGSEKKRTKRPSHVRLSQHTHTHALRATAPETSRPPADATRGNLPAGPLMPGENLAYTLNVARTAVSQPAMAAMTETKSVALSTPRIPIVRENPAYMLSTVRTTIVDASPIPLEKCDGAALAENKTKDSILMKLLNWRTYRHRRQQKQKLLQMLVATGSVRPGNVEFRYATGPEEGGMLARSFATPPPSDIHPPTALQTLFARLRGCGAQLVQQAQAQATCARPQVRGMQVFEWLRRSLTARSYLSRI